MSKYELQQISLETEQMERVGTKLLKLTRAEGLSPEQAFIMFTHCADFLKKELGIAHFGEGKYQGQHDEELN